MPTVAVRPGDEVELFFTMEGKTPLGEMKTQESSSKITYEDLLTRLQGKKKATQATKPGVKFSRIVALAVKAARTGKWSTGAVVEKDQVLANTLKSFSTLTAEDYASVTIAAKAALAEVYTMKEVTPQHKKELRDVLDKLGVAIPADETKKPQKQGAQGSQGSKKTA